MEDSPRGDELKLEVRFDRREPRMAQRAAMKVSPLWRRPVMMIPLGAVSGLVLVWLQKVLHRALPAGDPSVWVMLILAVVAVGPVVYGIKLVGRRSEEAERHEQHPDVYTLNEAGLEISGVDDLTLLSWSSMTRVHETDRFFLFVAGSEVQYLPKRSLDPAQAAQVRALAARHGPAAGRPRLGP
ncbi:MAG: YcxB family protein [Gemmatimonadales bacterium]|jgi:hypothetical protein